MTITLGWWLLPAILTLATICYAFWNSDPYHPLGSIADAFRLLVCIIITLVAWLVWALLR